VLYYSSTGEAHPAAGPVLPVLTLIARPADAGLLVAAFLAELPADHAAQYRVFVFLFSNKTLQHIIEYEEHDGAHQSRPLYTAPIPITTV
jgi:hypothetical protein